MEQEELIKKYGRESIQDLLLLMKPAWHFFWRTPKK
jgi:hypothetical protein